MRGTLPLLALLALTGPAAAGCVGSACVDSAGNVFTISPQGNILGLNVLSDALGQPVPAPSSAMA